MTGEKCFQVPKEVIPQLWHKFEAFLASGAERSSGTLTLESIKAGLAAGEMQLWSYWDGNECLGVAVSELGFADSGMKTCKVLIGSGHHRDKWQFVMRDTIKKFAELEGCGLFYMVTRPGWQRIFTDMKMTHVVLETRLGV